MNNVMPLRNEPRYGWVMVAISSILLGSGSGALATISVFMIPLIFEFGWSRGEAVFAYTVGAMATGLAGIGMGYLSDRFSSRPIVISGVFGLGLSLLLLSRHSNLWQLYLFYILLGGLGGAAFVGPLLTNLGYWFQRSRGLALGFAMAGRSMGQGLIPFLGGILIAHYGWRTAYLTLGAVSMVLLLPLAVLVREPPGIAEAKAAARSGQDPVDAPALSISPGTLVIWLCAAVVFCCFCMATALMHVVAMARDDGIAATSAASILTVIFTAGFASRILSGRLADRIGSIQAYFMLSATQTVMVFWFTRMDTLVDYYILAALFGLGFSGVMTCVIVCVQSLIPIHIRGRSQGIVSLFAWFGMGLGGWQGGYLFDLTGSYTLPFAMAVGAGVINLMIVGSLHLRLRGKPAPLAVKPGPA